MFESDTLNVETAALTKNVREVEDTPASTLAHEAHELAVKLDTANLAAAS